MDKSTNHGFIDKTEQKIELQKLERKKELAVAGEREIEKITLKHKDDGAFNKVIAKVTENKNTTVENLDLPEVNNKPKYRTDNLSSLSKEQRKFLGRVFSIIRSVLDESTAHQLIEKIEEELK